MTGSSQTEESEILSIDFQKLKSAAATGQDLIPAIAQDFETGDVLIIAYANKEAVEYSLKHKKATFWSTSRNELWVKGAVSGDELELMEARINCEQNSILYVVRPRGQGACHTKNEKGQARKSCFYRRIRDGRLEFIEK